MMSPTQPIPLKAKAGEASGTHGRRFGLGSAWFLGMADPCAGVAAFAVLRAADCSGTPARVFPVTTPDVGAPITPTLSRRRAAKEAGPTTDIVPRVGDSFMRDQPDMSSDRTRGRNNVKDGKP
jgi:hypothetical protein